MIEYPTQQERFDAQWRKLASSLPATGSFENALKEICQIFFDAGSSRKASDLKAFMETLKANLDNEGLNDAAFRKLTGDLLTEMFKYVEGER